MKAGLGWMPTLAAGLVLGVAFTLSPLTVLVVAMFPLLVQRVARTMPADERWWFVRLLVAALVLRLAATPAR